MCGHTVRTKKIQKNPKNENRNTHGTRYACGHVQNTLPAQPCGFFVFFFFVFRFRFGFLPFLVSIVRTVRKKRCGSHGTVFLFFFSHENQSPVLTGEKIARSLLSIWNVNVCSIFFFFIWLFGFFQLKVTVCFFFLILNFWLVSLHG